jgi:hypothetical protein
MTTSSLPKIPVRNSSQSRVTHAQFSLYVTDKHTCCNHPRKFGLCQGLGMQTADHQRIDQSIFECAPWRFCSYEYCVLAVTLCRRIGNLPS